MHATISRNSTPLFNGDEDVLPQLIGRVVSGSNDQPIIGATITSGLETIQTDKRGYFNIKVQSGNVTLGIFAKGFVPQTILVNISTFINNMENPVKMDHLSSKTMLPTSTIYQPKRDTKAIPFPRRPSGTEIDRFWEAYKDELKRCRKHSEPSLKSMFSEYFETNMYKSWEAELEAFHRLVQAICDDKEPELPYDLIYR